MKRVLLALLVMASVSCGSMTREGTASSYLVVAGLDAASGADPEEFEGDLESDVVTVVEGVSTIYSDAGRVTLSLALKDPGPAGSPLTPTANNAITVDRYRVRYIRSDGRNREGVDVPYAFDGAFTATVFDQTQATFTLVRAQAKAEAPLAALSTSLIVVSTIAEVTFYGHDQTGREVITTAKISVHFGNYGDPE
jgi:hypothetical protein